MKTLLIIYPHWPPSNLAGVHRARLIANYLPELGWQPLVLTVKPEYYEEPPDYDLCKTVSDKIIVEKTEARPAPKHLRLIGDIALRSLKHLRRRALQIMAFQKVDFIWIPIPSYYTALLGRQLHQKTNVPYGIDYIDPWVDGLPGQEKFLSRAWLSNQLAKRLEPYAVKKASLITGVSTPYYQPVLDRNFKDRPVAHVGMPYGFDPNDHKLELDNLQTPWQDKPDCKALVYAGAFLPKSHLFIDSLFQAIANLRKQQQWDDNIHLYFLGTGSYAGKSIADYARQYGIDDCVHEHRQRYPFLHILNFLSRAYGVMVVGSTEQHYTASKTFQALLSERPVFAVFHKESSAVEVMKGSQAADYLVYYEPEMDTYGLYLRLEQIFLSFIKQDKGWQPDLSHLEQYSSRESARKLVEQLDKLTD